MSARISEIEVLRLCSCQRMADEAADRVAALCRQPAFRWSVLARTAMFHEVAPLVLSNVMNVQGALAPAPPRLVERWNQVKVRNTLVKKRQARVARDIIAFFAARGSRAMLIKGVALDAVVYDEPWYTQSADVDLMVDQRWHALSVPDRQTLEAIWRRSSVELDFMRHHDVDMNRVLDVDYPRVWSAAREVPFADVRAYVMSPEDMLMSACVNLCRKRYRLLKGILAVHEIVRANPSLDWEELGQIARACGASRIVYGALSITSRVLGGDVPTGAVEALRIGASRRASIDTLTRRLSSQLSRAIGSPRECARVTSHLLRLATGHLPQMRREIRAHVRNYQDRKNPSPLSRFTREPRAQMPA